MVSLMNYIIIETINWLINWYRWPEAKRGTNGGPGHRPMLFPYDIWPGKMACRPGPRKARQWLSLFPLGIYRLFCKKEIECLVFIFKYYVYFNCRTNFILFFFRPWKNIISRCLRQEVLVAVAAISREVP